MTVKTVPMLEWGRKLRRCWNDSENCTDVGMRTKITGSEKLVIYWILTSCRPHLVVLG